MAFRVSAFADLCTVCRARTDSRCLRCGRPLCVAHVPATTCRCDSCEHEFKRSQGPMVEAAWLGVAAQPGPKRAWLWLSVTGIIFCAVSLTVSADVFFALLLVVPMTCLGVVEMGRTFSELVHRHRRHEERALRRRFLDERKPHLRLAPRS